MTTIVKASTASDFLALVPRLVGFEPHDSLVFVAFRGSRTCGAMRVDLPGRSQSRAHKRIATTLVGMLSKLPGVDAVVPVVYTGETFAASAGGPGAPAAGIPHSDFVDSVVTRLRFSGFVVRDALCVAADGWGSYLDPGRPPAGRPLAAIAGSPILDGVPTADGGPVGSVADLAALPPADPAARERVAASLGAFGAVLRGADPGRARRARVASRDAVGADARAAALRDIPATLEEIITARGDSVDPHAAAFVITISLSPAVRDVVMMQWAFDLALGERVLADAARFSRGTTAGALETAGLMLGRGPRPDPERVGRAISLLKSIAALAPDDSRAPVLCMLAWLNWALGRSSVADVFVAEALRVDPRYGLADLMRTVLERGILPEWAFADDAGFDDAGSDDAGSDDASDGRPPVSRSAPRGPS